MATLDPAQVKELLSKNWMTHDGMWFFHCLQKFGIAETNQLNLAAVRSMARLEAQRLGQALGLERVDSPEQLRRFVDGAFQVVKADFMDFNHRFLEDGSLRMDMGECFAYKGVERMGVLEHYQCGIYLRVDTWLETMGVSFQAEPAFEGCLKHQRGLCHRTYRFAW